MKTHFVFGLGALLLTTAAALADSRTRTVFYADDGIVEVGGREGFQTAVVFKADEKIENIAVGDSLAWQVTPNKRANVLFLKPVLANARTNMTVVTDKRMYMFDLVASNKLAGGMLYSLRFDYPKEAAPEPAAVKAEAPPSPPPVMNFAWTMKGEKKLFPAHVCDDGKSIYLDWDKSASVPAILTISADGSEGPVDYTVQGGTIVVATASRSIILRAGKDIATLINMAPANTAPANAAPVRSADALPVKQER